MSECLQHAIDILKVAQANLETQGSVYCLDKAAGCHEAIQILEAKISTKKDLENYKKELFERYKYGA